MKTKHILKSIIMVLLITFTGCEGKDELIEELQISREFAPVELTSIIRNQTIVELNWTKDNNVDAYLVEVSQDVNFSSIEESLSVASNQLPVQIQLIGETLYYIRVQAISSRGLENSTYATTTANTLTEQLFLSIEPGDILATEATLRWVPNSEVTQLIVNPGNIVQDITAQEATDGIAIVTGLTGETEYTAQLLNNSNIRGVQVFTTGIDIGDGILVTPTDDLFQMVADASPNDILVLDAGDYTSQTNDVNGGVLVIDKPLTIRGLYSFDKPILKVGFSIVDGATDVSLIDLDLTGDIPLDLTDTVRYSAAGNYNSLLLSGCNVHDYNRSFIAGNETDAIVQSVTVENCVVTNILTSGGDFFDFRNSDVLSVNFRTSTFNNCAPGRDFFRIDAAGTSNSTGLTTNILLENCTLYACSNSSSRRLFYVRFDANDIIARNNLITDTTIEGYSDNSATDETITFQNNNYFNAPTLFDSTVSRYDNSTSYTTLDPEFSNAEGGDFTVLNQSLIDNNVGDPRWLQ
ncbi:uncharacterized protein DUF5123 [Winogradskyella eximia]|uniref:Uncharacterized protein DUF5123 n=1 Tax=Winogradskyella eximia TaxID=262006 RepID=A0A3D9HBC0_9FLAO|nr:DUF5123 domain-containing protein [Winogradskyella eximia]RED46773.1 uncharacterized protein DUF5123 [Winogradskyella eximia]